jgi:hypothetical protein
MLFAAPQGVRSGKKQGGNHLLAVTQRLLANLDIFPGLCENGFCRIRHAYGGRCRPLLWETL